MASSAAPATSSAAKSACARSAYAVPSSPIATTCTSLPVRGQYAHVPLELATAASSTRVATNPAADSFFARAGSQIRCAAFARSSVATAVRSTYAAGALGIARGSGRPANRGFSGTRSASSPAERAARSRPSRSTRSVELRATRLPRTARTRALASRLTTFWWICAFAKRVSA